MNEVLQEFCDSRNVPVRVDHEKGVLRVTERPKAMRHDTFLS